MPLSPDPDDALARVRTLVHALPETEERPSHGQPTFFVAGKMFAQFRHDHHGCGQTYIAVKTGGADEAAMLIDADPELYVRVAYFRREWVGMIIGLDATDWDHAADRIAESWRRVAPARLTAA